MITIQGKGVSAGVGVGPLYFYRRATAEIKRYTVEDTDAEWHRFKGAQTGAIEQLGVLAEQARKEAGDEAAMLFATSVSEPVTIPPPSTRSSSPIPVSVRLSSSIEISFSTAGALCTPDSTCFFSFPPAVTETGSSTREFHALQPGHCPSHFAVS